MDCGKTIDIKIKTQYVVNLISVYTENPACFFPSLKGYSHLQDLLDKIVQKRHSTLKLSLKFSSYPLLSFFILIRLLLHLYFFELLVHLSHSSKFLQLINSVNDETNMTNEKKNRTFTIICSYITLFIFYVYIFNTYDLNYNIFHFPA